jgi:riboflavin transporter FmnP
MALLTALSVILAFLQIPIIPGTTLTYDASTLPAIIGGLAFGPVAGCIIVILGQGIHGLLTVDFIGMTMNIVLGLAFVLPSALICRKAKTASRIVIGLVAGSIICMAICVPLNLVAWPLYMWIIGGDPMTAGDVLPMVMPFILPFNAIKVVLNSILSFLLFKSLLPLLKPKGMITNGTR